MNIKMIAKAVGTVLAKNSPSILTGFGVACFIAGGIAAVVATPKAEKRIEAAKEEKLKNSDISMEELEETEEATEPTEEDKVAEDVFSGLTVRQTAKKHDISEAEVRSIMRLARKEKRQPAPGDLTKLEMAKVALPVYIPAILMALCATICVVVANKVNVDRTMAAVAACELSGNALKEYQDKTAEKFGEKADKEIKDEIAKDAVEKNPPANNQVIITGDGDYLCYDAMSKRYFRSTSEKIQRAILKLNKLLQSENWCSLNDYYDWINLPGIEFGDDIGWYAWEYADLVEPHFSYQPVSDEDDTPCLVVSFWPTPKHRSERR